MLIQTLTLDDIPEVCRIGSKEPAFQVSESKAFWSPDQLSRWVEAGEDVLLVAKDNQQIVGFALSTLHKPTGKATWENLYVDPDARGRGVGTALTEEMVRQLKLRGVRHICFFVRSENSNEIDYFASRGFAPGHAFVWFSMDV